MFAEFARRADLFLLQKQEVACSGCRAGHSNGWGTQYATFNIPAAQLPCSSLERPRPIQSGLAIIPAIIATHGGGAGPHNRHLLRGVAVKRPGLAASWTRKAGGFFGMREPFAAR
jgi:hypothetical protein